jgi:hypothetical protein
VGAQPAYAAPSRPAGARPNSLPNSVNSKPRHHEYREHEYREAAYAETAHASPATGIHAMHAQAALAREAAQAHEAAQARQAQTRETKQRSRRGSTALLVLAAAGLALSIAAFITNSGVSSLASAALPGSDRANFADRFFLSAKNAESAALQPFRRYVMARAEPETTATTARDALASRWMPADFRASISDNDGSQLVLPTIGVQPPVAPTVTAATSTNGIPLPRSRPTAADQTAQITSQALALAAAPPNRPAERSLMQKLSDMMTPSRTAMLSTGPNLFGKGPDLSAFGYDGATAVYDLKARAVYLPNGTVFEAHSGMGALRDDPDHVDVRMQGATPPAVYSLKPREREFHGVAALRMTVADGSDINGRSGLLVHSFMLGPNGDSNGCISVKDYDRFLKAYNDGQFTHIAVVPSLKAVAETLAAQADPG